MLIRGERVASNGFFIITKKMHNPSVYNFYLKTFSMKVIDEEI